MMHCTYDSRSVCTVCNRRTRFPNSLRVCCGKPNCTPEYTNQPVERVVSSRVGVGTELKKLLAGWPFRIVASQNCSCNAKAAVMDDRGIEWCENNIEVIVGWLREEAKKRKLPFLNIAGRLLVRRAIHNARKLQCPATN